MREDALMNDVIRIGFLLIGGVLMASLLALVLTAAREGHGRARGTAAVAAAVFAALWFGGYLILDPPPWLMLALSLAVLAGAALFFLPWGRTTVVHVGAATGRADERDVVFAREEYLPGTEKHTRYYRLRPENRAVDDRIRALPPLLAPGGRHYDPQGSAHVADIFRVIEAQLTRVDGPVAAVPVDVEPGAMTRHLKGLVRHLGADDVGVARLHPKWVYSHVGRGPEPWGQPIENRHRYAICFALEMDYHRVQSAPSLPITEESATQYLKGAQISIALAAYIRNLGHSARAHIAGSNYQIMLPPVAHDAGLGELGRMGYLIHPRLGARMRLGAVTTDLPLLADEPIAFGVQDFCAACKKCAINCPSGAIPRGARRNVRGVRKWPLASEQCLHYWRVIGTDCGLCMKVCPYSHPPTLLHNLVRVAVARSAFARAVSVKGDDFLYGRRAPGTASAGEARTDGLRSTT